MSIFTIELLGPPIFKIDYKEISFSRKKAIALLTYIICNNRTFYREEIAEFLWPEVTPSKSLSSLRTVISEIKKKINNEIFITENNKIFIDRTNLSCDYLIFKDLLSSQHTIWQKKKAAELWKGGFLKGFYLKNSSSFYDWQIQEEQNILLNYKKILKQLYENEIQEKNYSSALNYANQSLVLDNFDEETHRAIIYIHALNGNRQLALNQFEHCKKIINEEFNSSLENETLLLLEKIKRGTIKRQSSLMINEATDYRLAILPFTINNIFDENNLLFLDMILESLEDYFAKFSHIKTISRTSTLTYKNEKKRISIISRELNTNYIIEGCMGKINNTIIIKSRLIDPIKDIIIKANNINIFSFKNEDPSNIARVIGSQYLPCLNINSKKIININSKFNKGKSNSISNKLKLQAQYLLRINNEENCIKAIKMYKKAVNYNEKDAEAWAGLAKTLLMKGDKEICCPNQMNFLNEAERAAKKALDLNKDEPTALNVFGKIKILTEWNFKEAEALYIKSLQIMPNNYQTLLDYSELCILTNNYTKSKKLSDMAFEINPISHQNFKIKFWLYLVNKEYKKAKKEVKQQFILYPNPALENIMYSYIYLIENKIDKAIKKIEKVEGNIPLSWQNALHGSLGYAYSQINKPKKAYQEIEILLNNTNTAALPNLPIALTYIGLKEYDKALIWIEKSILCHDHALFFLCVNPLFAPLNSLEKLKTILQQTNIKPITNY